MPLAESIALSAAPVACERTVEQVLSELKPPVPGDKIEMYASQMRDKGFSTLADLLASEIDDEQMKEWKFPLSVRRRMLRFLEDFFLERALTITGAAIAAADIGEFEDEEDEQLLDIYEHGGQSQVLFSFGSAS